jgi:ribonuclease BN (tRNA processing enzyme)
VRLHILGSNGTYPTPGRPASGYVVQHQDTVVWCDAGPGTFVELWDRFDLQTLDAVAISHEHPDHCSDLLSAYHALAHGPLKRSKLPVYCPASVIERISGFVRAGEGHPLAGTFDFRPVADGDRVEVGEIALGFRTTDHSVPTVGVRFECEGRVLAYSADTGAAGTWDDIAHEADLFLCEASYQGHPGDHDYTQHLTAGQAGQIARARGSKRLMLTHIPAHLDAAKSLVEAETAFDRPVSLAVPGTVHDV